MLFIHGFGASSYSWQRILPHLSKTNRLLLVDLKGHGASPKPFDSAYSLRDQADLVADFIEQHDLQDMTLVGHSMGGGVALLLALKFAAQARNRVSSLILIDTVAYSQRLPRFIRLLRAPLLGRLITAITPTRLQVRLVLKRAYFEQRRITDETVAAYSAPLRLPGANHALLETAKQIVPMDIEEISAQYAALKMPSLIIWGSHDQVISLDIGRRLNRALPNSRLAIIEESGHIPQEETPDKALTEILQFLESTR
jgi:pimeloyl-ACP methyl ester carboxylesterase